METNDVRPQDGKLTQRRPAPLFARRVPELGELTLRPLRMPDDMPLVHDWTSREYARYWGLVGKSLEQVTDAYREILSTAQVYVGSLGDAPAFLVECYHPADDAVGAHYAVEESDRGMHILIAPASTPRAGFSWACFRAVMDFLFSDPDVERVVVEPDIRNGKIHALNRRAGFRYQKVIELPGKTAHLAFCTRQHYQAAVLGELEERAPDHAVAHLTPEVWAKVNRWLVRKSISEFCHERLFEPELLSVEGAYRRFTLATDQAGVSYRFRARLLALEHWDIEVDSLEKLVEGRSVRIDALDFFIEFRARLDIDPAMLPVYLEEISATLYAAAYKHVRQRLSSADLVHASFQEVEAAMAEGHPAFVANSGRVGFDVDDYLAFAPEAAAPVQLVWLAAHRRHAEFNAVEGLTEAQLLELELGRDVVEGFRTGLREQGLDPDAYVFMPVHPWQWRNKLALVFAPDLAARNLVYLGVSSDFYQAQQSIRTFFNQSRPERRYVKTALSVLNMGFMRGLSADYMRNTPAINDFLDRLIRSDATLQRKGFAILREAASVGYSNPYFERAVAKTSPYRKMLAALWRDSPVPLMGPRQRLMTMAALLHRDRDGVALLPELIKASGLSIDAWLERYLEAYLAPLFHCFFQHDLSFMPHGENLILLLEDNVPVRAFMKDIAEEVAITNPALPVPEKVRRICIAVPDELRTLDIFTDVFDGIFRYMAQILLEQADYAEPRFWGQVAACLHRYRREHPELAEKIARYDFFVPEFTRSCLNRLQLRNNQQMVDLSDPLKNLRFVGTLENPIARFRDAE